MVTVHRPYPEDVPYPRALARFPVLALDGAVREPNPRGTGYCLAHRWILGGARGSHDAPRGSGHLHRGEDIMAPRGSVVVAPCALRVTKIGEGGDGGHYLYAVESDGIEWYFSHFAEAPTCAVGDRLAPGQPFAKVGNTGNASRTCPHLHLRAKKGRAYFRLVGALLGAPGAPPTKAPKGAKASAP